MANLDNCLNFCANCGYPLETKEGLIRYYFGKGFQYDTILQFLEKHHGVKMCVRTLQSRLEEYGLKRKRLSEDEEQIRAAIAIEADGPGCLQGYRSMWHCLRLKYKIFARRSTVQRLLREMDPVGSSMRRNHRFKRRQYVNPGPNWCWHVDGHDKLKPFGFPIHGCIDGFSRRIMWLRVTRTNNNPYVIGKYFLECVREHGCCPTIVQTDCGTENGVMSSMQCYFRQNYNDEFADLRAHRYGTSTSNQRIECWWSFFSRNRGQWWVDFFKDLREQGIIQTTVMHQECLWFCFSELIQNDLDHVKDHWNTHAIRPSRHDTVAGRPDELYFLAENNCAYQISEQEMQDMQEYCTDPDNDNIHSEYFAYAMAFLNLPPPHTWREAIELYHILLEQAQP